MIFGNITGLIYGAAAALILALSVAVGIDHVFTIPSLRKQVSTLTAERDTGQSDIAALRAGQDVQNESIRRLVAAAHYRDAEAERSATARIAAARRAAPAAHTAQELNQWLESLSQPR